MVLILFMFIRISQLISHVFICVIVLVVLLATTGVRPGNANSCVMLTACCTKSVQVVAVEVHVSKS